jgi:hypothetical protein
VDKGTIVAILTILAVMFFVVLPRCGEVKAGERVIYWEQKLAKDIPLNSSRDRVAEWARDNSVDFSNSGGEHAVAEVEQVTGLGFIDISCPDWKVLIDIAFDSFDEVVAETVRKVSECS